MKHAQKILTVLPGNKFQHLLLVSPDPFGKKEYSSMRNRRRLLDGRACFCQKAKKNIFCYPESLKHAESDGENHFKKFQQELTFSKGRRESLLCPFLNSPRGLEAAPPFFHPVGVSLGPSKRAKKSFDRRARGSRRRSCSCRWSILCGLEASG